MRHTNESTSWVVYRVAAKGTRPAMTAVCDQHEWDAMEAATPGLNTLVRDGIASEGEAEQLARRQGE